MKKKYIGWHGSNENITEFKEEFPEGYFAKEKKGAKNAIFFSKDKAPEGSVYGKRLYQKQFIIEMDNPLIVDGKKGYSRDEEGFKALVNRAIKNGYDGVVVKNVHDNFVTDIYISLNAKKIRLINNKNSLENKIISGLFVFVIVFGIILTTFNLTGNVIGKSEIGHSFIGAVLFLFGISGFFIYNKLRK
jgi:hypothetical protein